MGRSEERVLIHTCSGQRRVRAAHNTMHIEQQRAEILRNAKHVRLIPKRPVGENGDEEALSETAGCVDNKGEGA